jgi:hypothetical protein
MTKMRPGRSTVEKVSGRSRKMAASQSELPIEGQETDAQAMERSEILIFS